MTRLVSPAGLRATFLILSFIATMSMGFGQYTAIPDPNFEQALIDLGIDGGAFLTEYFCSNCIKL